MSVVALNNLQDITITTKGKEILGKIISGEDYTIYKAKIGTGTLPSTEKEEDQTDLITEYKEIAISNVTVLDSGGYQIEIVYDNLGVTALTDITELGIYMADASNGETLYAYSYSATPLVLIPESKGVVEITNRINVYLVDGDTVNAHIDRTGTYVTIEDLEQKLKLKMDVSAAGSGFGLHKSDAIDSDDSDTVATSKAVHDVNVKVDADKKILTSTTTTANNAVVNAKKAQDTADKANTLATSASTVANAAIPKTERWIKDYKVIGQTTTPLALTTFRETGNYKSVSSANKWSDLPSGADSAFTMIVDSISGLNVSTSYLKQTLSSYNTNATWVRVDDNSGIVNWGAWSKIYSEHIKPTKADVGLGSVGNHGITDSTTANSSTTYASSKAVTTVHNEATAASTAASKAQTTANGALPKTGGIMTGPITTTQQTTWITAFKNPFIKQHTASSGYAGMAISMFGDKNIFAMGGLGDTQIGFYTIPNTQTANSQGNYCGMDTTGSWRSNGEIYDKHGKVYGLGNKPTATDVGLGSVHNYGITDSTTANNSSIYASSKAVTTVHNEAHAASTAAAKANALAVAAQSTANTANAKLVSEGRQDNSTFKANTKLKSGFYRPGSGADVSNYSSMIVADNNDTGLQIAGGYTTDHLLFRGWDSYGKTFTPWRTVYHDGHKPTAADVGLGSVHNYGITDSTTANSSTTYASSKAVTTVHNEAVINGSQSIGLGSSNKVTTAQFITKMQSLGAFNGKPITFRGAWTYAAQMLIVDGAHIIGTAGAVIECFGTGTAKTVRITCPTTGAGSNSAGKEYIYIDNGSAYGPGWRQTGGNSCPYRVGDILHTISTANPATTWIGTAWTKIEGRVLIGANSTYPNTHTGGASSIHLSGGHIPSHSHSVSINTNSTGNHSHTVANHSHSQPAHSHSVSGWLNDGNASPLGGGYPTQPRGFNTNSAGGETTGGSAPGTNTTGNHAHTVHGNTGAYGSASAFNIMNPWYAVNIWRRTS